MINKTKPATVKDVKQIVTEIVLEATDAILSGVDKLMDQKLEEQEKRFDKKFATKEDLKREISFVRSDIKGLKADLSETPSKQEFTILKQRVDNLY